MFVKICHSAGSGDGLGRIDLVKHSITTGDALSIKQPPRRLSFLMREEADNLLVNMLRKGVVEPSSCPWASGVVLVKKKDGPGRRDSAWTIGA